MNANLGLGGRNGGGLQTTRMEAELSAWLRSFEPAGAPIAMRLRTSADLQAAAELSNRRFSWLASKLSPIGSLAAVVLAVGAIFILALMGRISGGTVGAPGLDLPPTTGPAGLGQTFPGIDGPLFLLLALAAAGLAGASVYLRPVRVAFGRVVYGRGAAAPGALLPFRRPLRDLGISRLTWALGIAAVALIGWWWWIYQLPASVAEFVVTVVYAYPVFLAFAIALRYPRRDRSGRLMLAGAQMLAVGWALGYVVAIAGWAWMSNGDEWARRAAEDFISALRYALSIGGWGALAAGLAVRSGLAAHSGLARRPRPILAAVAIGAPLFLTAAERFVYAVPIFGDSSLTLAFVVLLVFSTVSAWLVWVAWLAILWIGSTAALRRGGPGWWLISFAAAANAVFALKAVLVVLGPRQFGLSLDNTGWPIEESLVWGPLLVGLLVGLNPVLPGTSPAPEPSPEPAPEGAAGA